MGIWRNTLNWYSRLSPRRGKSKPPYYHVTQIGDPTLRRISEPVALDRIKTEEIQLVIKRLKDVIDKYGSLGMSAPQIGVNLRMFAMQFSHKQLLTIDNVTKTTRQITTIPFTVYINPEIKVLDYAKISFCEGCESIQGYEADVPRYKAVQVMGLDQNGEAQTQSYSGWSARIVQHELDHLDGKLFTDIMDKKTFKCVCWEEVNLSKGKVVLPFIPD